MVAPGVLQKSFTVTVLENVPPFGEKSGVATVLARVGLGVTVGVGVAVGVGVTAGVGVGVGTGVGVGVAEGLKALYV